MNLLTIEYIVMDTSLMFIPLVSYIDSHAISWIMKDFVKLSEIFLRYTFL